MRRFLLAIAVLALVAAESQAGPIRNLFHRFQERRAARVSGSCSSCSSCSSCQSAPVAAYTVPAAAPRSCPDGRCPLRSESPVIEQPASPSPPVVEPTVVVFATPRRMP